MNRISTSGVPNTVILQALGSATTSSIGYSYAYNTLDDPIKPRKGFTFQFSQDFAGFGGTVKYIRTETAMSVHRPILWDEFVRTLSLTRGYIQGYGGEQVRLNDRFFRGGDTFRRFSLAGIGPREITTCG